MSSGLAPIRVANDWRKLRATEKKDWSSTMCGRLFAARDNCTALSATRGIAACAAKFKYVASSIGNHSFSQSIDCFTNIGFLLLHPSEFKRQRTGLSSAV